MCKCVCVCTCMCVCVYVCMCVCVYVCVCACVCVCGAGVSMCAYTYIQIIDRKYDRGINVCLWCVVLCLLTKTNANWVLSKLSERSSSASNPSSSTAAFMMYTFPPDTLFFIAHFFYTETEKLPQKLNCLKIKRKFPFWGLRYQKNNLVSVIVFMFSYEKKKRAMKKGVSVGNIEVSALIL